MGCEKIPLSAESYYERCELIFKKRSSLGAQRGLFHLERTEGLNEPNCSHVTMLTENPFLKF